MPDDVRLWVDGEQVTVPAGASVAAALFARRGGGAARRSVRGMTRAPLCGMGVCQECRVTIDGEPHQRACMRQATAGLQIVTGTS